MAASSRAQAPRPMPLGFFSFIPEGYSTIAQRFRGFGQRPLETLGYIDCPSSTVSFWQRDAARGRRRYSDYPECL